MLNYFKLVRLPNLLMMVCAQLLMIYYFIPENTYKYSFQASWLPVLSVFLIAAAGYVINDYYDQEIDQINKPHRRLIGVCISEKNALLLYYSLNLVSVALTVLHINFLLLNSFFMLLLWSYARFFKKKPFIGNLIVASCIAFSIWITQLFYVDASPEITFYAVFAWFSNLIREIIKDLEDVKGDQAYSSQTLPIIFGVKKSKYIITLITILFSISLLFSSVILRFRIFYAIAFQLFLVGSTIYLFKAQTSSDYRVLSTLHKFFMLVGVLSVS